MTTLTLTLVQQPVITGDLDRNVDALLDVVGKAAAEGSQVVVAPGCPVAGDAGDLAIEAGFAGDLAEAEARVWDGLAGTPVEMVTALTETPGRDVQDVQGVPVATVSLGDDTDLAGTVADAVHRHGARLVLISAALPFRMGAPERRRADVVAAARANRVWVALVNRVGGGDDRVYDGGSLLVSPAGEVVYQGPLFEAATATVTLNLAIDFDTVDGTAHDVPGGQITDWPGTIEQVYTALVVGTRDYVHHNGFTDVVIGLSGGIDSAVVAAIAADALGGAHVHGIGMPGPYSSPGSVTDAVTLAENLGLRYAQAPITAVYEAEVASLGPLLDGPGAAVAKENIQARLRALHLFTVANARNALVLNTCQKSEDLVGYATYGGDALGSYAPMVDVPKGLVYELAVWRNTGAWATDGPVIPADSISKPPSAELAPGQQDTDSLPPYDVLDVIMERYLAHRETPDQIVAHLTATLGAGGAGADYAAMVLRVLTLMDRAEWKRRQAPVGPQVSDTPLWARRVPLTNRRTHHLG